jgi:hypothetical protein
LFGTLTGLFGRILNNFCNIFDALTAVLAELYFFLNWLCTATNKLSVTDFKIASDSYLANNSWSKIVIISLITSRADPVAGRYLWTHANKIHHSMRKMPYA